MKNQRPSIPMNRKRINPAKRKIDYAAVLIVLDAPLSFICKLGKAMSTKIVPLRPSKNIFYKEVTIDGGEPVQVSPSDVERWILKTQPEEIQKQKYLLHFTMEDPGLSDALEFLVRYHYGDSESLVEIAKWMEGKKS